MNEPDHLHIMLPMPVRIVSYNRERIMDDGRPTSHFTKSYTVRLTFQNTTVETDIQEGDPRFPDIENHCKLHKLME